ncbi:MAG: UDP-2,3-diacylglucosamine diphosphatase, partial [Hydrogenophaga sp.]|jgi:UDP-2,3-diacylglucosamine hydrolase|nr:UDP-2,3-diacylglucosamine diphosphatase [Hydrogenophaga sp.]
MPSTVPPDRFAELHAPAQWQAVEFISDLHLHAADPTTFKAWRRWLERPLTQRADALFVLGDLFEVWVGDDLLDAPPAHGEAEAERAFYRACAALLRVYSAHTPVYFMAGNRDFLLGPSALQQCGMQGLSDPTVLCFLGQRWLLSHGDALCIDDTDYMRFRDTVRQPAWSREFLGRALNEREAIARALRQQSEARKHGSAGDPQTWADVDAEAARAWLLQAQASTLIHGHTHRPALHRLSSDLQRVVLSDWDLSAQPPRAEVLRLDRHGVHRLPLVPAP